MASSGTTVADVRSTRRLEELLRRAAPRGRVLTAEAQLSGYSVDGIGFKFGGHRISLYSVALGAVWVIAALLLSLWIGRLFEDRVMKMSTVDVGDRCTIGALSLVLYDTRMEADAKLNSLSLLMKGETLPAATKWEGVPARSPQV